MTYNEFLRRFLTAISIIVLLVGLWYVRSILILGFAAILVAVGVSIPAGWLQRRGLKRPWSLIMSATGLGITAVLLALWIVPTLITETGNLITGLPTALEGAETAYSDWRKSSELLRQLLPSLDIQELTEATSEVNEENLNDATGQIFNFGLAVLPVLEGVGSIFTLIANIGVMLFIAAFFLTDPRSYIKASLMLLPQPYHPRALAIWDKLYQTLQTWISAQMISISITAALVWLILGVVLNVPNAGIVATFAGLATFIPNLGVLPLIPIFIFTLAHDPTQLIWALPTYLIIQLLESNLITPSIVKAELDIPAGAVMLFQLIATFLFGTLGLLLAVPLMAVIITLIREIYTFDILGLQGVKVELGVDAMGNLQLRETAVNKEPKQEIKLENGV